MTDPITREELERRLEETYIAEEQWERKGVAFSLYAPRERGSGPRLVVRQPSYWHAENAEIAFATLSRCRDAAARQGEPHFVARPYWWGTSPPFLCVEWIDGEDLRSSMRSRMARDDASAWLLEVLTAAGALMASYHVAVADWPMTAYDGAEIALRGRSSRVAPRLARIARRLAGSVAASVEIPVRGLSDPSAGNIVIDEKGRLWLIDLPDQVELRAVQWDAALLAYKLGRAVNRVSRLVPDRFGVSYGDVFDAVRAGHASHFPAIVGSEQSIGLFYSFLACEAVSWFVSANLKGKLTLGAMTGRMVGRSLVATGHSRMLVRRASEPFQGVDAAGFGPGSGVPTSPNGDGDIEQR